MKDWNKKSEQKLEQCTKFCQTKKYPKKSKKEVKLRNGANNKNVNIEKLNEGWSMF
jgi:hypothetical protein